MQLSGLFASGNVGYEAFFLNNLTLLDFANIVLSGELQLGRFVKIRSFDYVYSFSIYECLFRVCNYLHLRKLGS